MLKFKYSHFTLECGSDEAGRGCLSGPVTAAAVILPVGFENAILNDSKQVSEKKRDFLRLYIEEHALAFSVSHVYPDKIDEINILNASILAMHKAIETLKIKPEFIIIDGNRFKSFQDIPYQTIVKGDSKYLSIAAASILAKTHRDDYMKAIHQEFPIYNWEQNKGYPTKEHRRAIKKHGITAYHRKTFKLLSEQLKLQL